MWNFCRFLSSNIYPPFYLLIISPLSPSSLLDQRRRPDLLCPKHTNIFPMMSASCPAQLGSLRLSKGSAFYFFLLLPFFPFLLTAAADSSGIRRPCPPRPPAPAQALPRSPRGSARPSLLPGCSPAAHRLFLPALGGPERGQSGLVCEREPYCGYLLFHFKSSLCSGEQRGR